MENHQDSQDWGDSPEYEALVSATHDARLRYFRTLGEPEADVWWPLVNPVLRGGPEWPTRPAWQRIRNGEATLIASSGLCDPFADVGEPNFGYAVETAICTTDRIGEDLRASWAFEFAMHISSHAASDAMVDRRYAKYGPFLFGMKMEDAFWTSWSDAEGYVGLLVGMPIVGLNVRIGLPSGEAAFLPSKLLTPAEYSFVAEHGPSGAERLVELFGEDGTIHLSSLDRRSVV